MRKHIEIWQKKLFYKAKIGHLVSVMLEKGGGRVFFRAGDGDGVGEGVGEGSVALDPGSELE